MTFIVNSMVGKRINSNDTVFGFVKKNIDVGFQNKLIFSKFVFLIDMYRVPASTNLHDKLKIAGG